MLIVSSICSILYLALKSNYTPPTLEQASGPCENYFIKKQSKYYEQIYNEFHDDFKSESTEYEYIKYETKIDEKFGAVKSLDFLEAESGVFYEGSYAKIAYKVKFEKEEVLAIFCLKNSFGTVRISGLSYIEKNQ